jgi:hypothetical protein
MSGQCGPEQMMIVCRDNGLEKLGEQRLHGAKHRVCMAEFCVVSAARLSARSTRLSGCGMTFRPGRRPRKLVRRPWSASGWPCVAWAKGVCVMQRHGSSTSGGMSGWRPRKVVLAVRWVYGGVGGCRGGGPKTLSMLRALQRDGFLIDA